MQCSVGQTATVNQNSHVVVFYLLSTRNTLWTWVRQLLARQTALRPLPHEAHWFPLEYRRQFKVHSQAIGWTQTHGDIVFKPIRGLKKEVSSFLVIYLDWNWSWFIFDTENFVCLNFHFFLPQFVISNQRLWHRNQPFEFLPSSPSLPPQITKIQRQIRIEKDKFIMSWMLPHEKILFPRVNPWRLITLDDAHVHGMSKYFALLRVSSDKDVMAIQINLYQGIPNLMNISDNKMVQIPEHHHTINVKN